MVVPGIYDIWLTRHPWLFKYRGFPSVSLFLPELILFALRIWSRSAVEIYTACMSPAVEEAFRFQNRGVVPPIVTSRIPGTWNCVLALLSIYLFFTFNS